MNLMLGDCLERMREIPDGSVDLVLTDPPYGTTACKWDAVIPFEPMWEQVWRVLKPSGAAVFTASQPFTSALVMSYPKAFKYQWVWDKKVASNSQLCKIQPLKIHEDVLVFCKSKIEYNPQGLSDVLIERSNKNRNKGVGHIGSLKKRETFTQTKTGYPKSILNFKPNNIGKVHPTQKPVALMEYLIRTYTNEGETVLDFTMGSGTTGVACVKTGRNFIGIERDENYFKIAQDRIQKAIDDNERLL